MALVVGVQVPRWAFISLPWFGILTDLLPDLRMHQSTAQQQQPRPVGVGYRSVPREFVDPPAVWNPTVGLFFGGYALAALTIWGWFVAALPLPVLLCTGFLALHLEGTVIHDACHNAAPVSYTHLRAHETKANLVCRLLLEKKNR